jgi:hypothetical protein
MISVHQKIGFIELANNEKCQLNEFKILLCVIFQQIQALPDPPVAASKKRYLKNGQDN